MWPVGSHRSSIRRDTRGLGTQHQLLANLVTGEISKSKLIVWKAALYDVSYNSNYRAIQGAALLKAFPDLYLIPLSLILVNFFFHSFVLRSQWGDYRWGISCSKSFLRGSRALPREPWTKAGAQTDSNRPAERETQASSWIRDHATSPRLKSNISLSSFLCCLQSQSRATQKWVMRCFLQKHKLGWIN